jgi:hypothetical protein
MSYDGSCPVCAYAAAHGSWPPDHRGTHCPECGRSWAAKRQSHCALCHQSFSADSVGDKHRVDGKCLTSDEMRERVTNTGKPVFRMDTTRDGVVWRGGQTLTVKPAFLLGEGE